MGNSFCPAEGVPHLASIARDVCPFPNYNPNPLFSDMLSINSSLHLRNHYTAVQSSLTPEQLEHFTQGLRTTFGREGKVTHGGVGVVALSLAVLFDTLAKQARGEWVSDSGPIPGLFFKEPRGYYPPYVYTVSEYLRLVPHIANNPTRMKEETERYFKQLVIEDESLDKLGENHMLPIQEDITLENMVLGKWFTSALNLHLVRIKNGTTDDLRRPNEKPPAVIIYNFNCDPEEADKQFLAEVQKSDNRTQEDFKRYMTNVGKTWLLQVAEIEFITAMFHLSCEIGQNDESKIAQREDFDLKANALGKWTVE